MFALIMAVSNAFVPLVALFALSGGAPLGVQVPAAKMSAPVVVQSVRGYRRFLVGLAVVLFALTFGLGLIKPGWTSLGALPALIGVFWGWYHFSSAIRRAKKEEGWYDGVPVRLQGSVVEDNEPYYPWSIWGYVVSIAALVLGTGYLASRWSDIPNRFATHFGAGFEPNAWSDKSVGSVFFGSIMAVSMLALFAGLSFLTLRYSSSRMSGGAPGMRRSARLRADSITMLGWTSAAMTVLMVGIQLVTAIPEFQGAMPAVFVVGIVGIMGSILGLIAWMMIRAENAARPLPTDPPVVDSPDTDEFYKWGMFYYNPDNPAVMVEKRMGMGWTFNFATWQAKAVTAGLLLLPLLALLPAFM